MFSNEPQIRDRKLLHGIVGVVVKAGWAMVVWWGGSIKGNRHRVPAAQWDF